MALPLLNLDQRFTLVCSADRSVTLKLLPADPLKPVAREKRSPTRCLEEDEVELVGTDATKVVVRLIDEDEQMAVTGGLQGFASATIGPARQRALKLGIVGAQGPGLDARTPAEVELFRKRLPIRWAEMLGDWILDHSCGFDAPFDSTE